MSPSDTLTRAGAEELVRAIRAYWQSKGVKVALTIVEEAYHENKRALWGIRSDLRNGKPVSHRDVAA